MPVKHLLQQVEIYRSTRAHRDSRPQWVSEFVDATADLFEPLIKTGRVGFDCQPADDCWIVGLYLGSTEIVGGCDDGQSQHTDFQFDLLRLLELFGDVVRFQWSVFPDHPDSDGLPASSFVTVEGCVDGNPILLQLYSVPPAEAGPGFLQYLDGHRDPV